LKKDHASNCRNPICRKEIATLRDEAINQQEKPGNGWISNTGPCENTGKTVDREDIEKG